MNHVARNAFMGLWAQEEEEEETSAQGGGTAAPQQQPEASVELAMEHARARLPKDGTGEPYGFFGLTVPLKAVRTLGSDAAFYVRFIQEGLIVTFAVLIAQLFAILNNMGSGWPKNNESWAEQ